MATTLNQIADDLLLIARGGRISDDEPIENSQIKEWIHTQRAKWLRNELNKNRSIDDNIVQDLGCVEFEKTDAADCCDISTDCYVLRSKKEIPVAIELHHKSLITRVGPIEKTDKQKFHFMEYERALWTGNGQFNTSVIAAFLMNNKMHLVGSKHNDLLKMLKYANIRGVFENPPEASIFNTCSGNPCYTDDSKYPINKWILDYLKTEILQSRIAIEAQSPSDTTNDGEHNAQGIREK